jgi:hypothetical protein
MGSAEGHSKKDLPPKAKIIGYSDVINFAIGKFDGE